MIVYHASPNDKIKKLYDKSYVTIFPHIAYYMGLSFDGKTWTDNDLEKPYGFETEIHFKKGRKPTTKPILYKLEIEPNNIIMHKNFPFEFQIVKGVKVEKVGNIDNLVKLSKKMGKLYDKLN
jgi:hypothetical protein